MLQSRRLLLLPLLVLLSLLFLFFAASYQAAPGDNGLEVYQVDPRTEQIRFYWQKSDGVPYENIIELLGEIEARRDVRMVLNGGIYGTDLRPLGLYIENGRRMVPLNLADGVGNFFLKPNGVFLLRQDGTAQIVDATQFADSPDITNAVQSGPLMLARGVIHPRIRPDGTSRLVRNAVGVTRDGAVVFLITRRPMSFYEFTTAARDRHGVWDLLYLDGTLSQMHLAPESPPEPGRPFVTMLSVERMRR